MRGLVLAGVLLLVAAFASPAVADPQPWNGSSPFACTVQNGLAPTEPNADPFCASYDHSGQSLADAQAALTGGPAELAAASNKCAVYQVDHWVGPTVAGIPAYEFDDAMYFDKSTGTGGLSISNFQVAGVTSDPRTIPGFPAQLSPFFGPGGGGAQMPGNVQVDPNCSPPPPPASGGGGGTAGGGGGIFGGLGGPNPGAKPRTGSLCKSFKGNAKNGLGKARLGLKRVTVRRKLGKPTRRAHGFYHYCLRRGGDLAIHFGKGSKVDVVMTNGKSFHAGKIKMRSRLRTVRSSLKHEQVLGHRKRDWVIAENHKGWKLLVGLSKNRVVYIAAVSRKLSLSKLAQVLTNAGK
jgi:hypothetical protein